ncbi:MAG: ATP-binding protein, partial [Bacillota bacterium]|nr:ATP-binding protein [Bacillota bacterium]
QISQLDNDRIFLEEAEFRLDEQIRQVILLLEPNWSKKNIDLGIDLDECTYRGKEELLVQVWVNLLDNAIKFTEPGGQIIIRLQKRESLRLRIADTGSGMDEETRRRVFEQFYQGDPSRKLEGAGLGMSIVKRILDLHAADIFIDSEPGKGTEIEVVLSSKKPSQF